MEDEPEVPDLVRRSKRARVPTKAYDGQPSRIRDVFESEEDSGDEFDVRRRKPNKNRTGEAVPAATVPIGFENLIEVVKMNGKHIPQAVKAWVEQYEKDPKPAIVELLTMLFEACGATYRIQGEFLDETNVDDVVVALVNLAAQGKIEDYQSSKKKEFRSFKENLVSFWDNLVSECQNGPLFDQVLFDKCMDYVIALSCTPPRVYRQVASLVGLQLVTSFIGVAKILGAQRQTTQRQLTAEKKKNAEGPHVESLNKRLSEFHEKITMIEEMMRKIFTGLFMHRYRDIDPDIRMSCIQSLGAWIVSYPSLFLQDLYLKYLGWTLNDKNAGVRKASVLALQNLYDVDDNVPSLGLFTERFYKRMLDLADDVDISVAVCAISLVKQLLRHQLVPDDDLGSLYDLLIDDPPEIRSAIGALVYDHVIAQKFNSSQPRSSGDEGDTSQIHLLRMLQILREFSTDQVLSQYVIDDIWEFMDAMKDWKRITSMLLDENPSIELTDDDATNLARLFCASVKKAVGEKIVPAADHRKQSHTKAQREVIQNSRKEITVTMMKNYPQLMRKYMADKTKVPSLLEIISHMDLELYSLKSQEQKFKTLLQLMKEAFFKHGDKDALRSCVKAINYCTTRSQGELQDYAQNKLKELEDELISKLKTALKEVQDGGDEYLLHVNMKRLYELQLTRPVPIESLYDEIIKVLKNVQNIDDEVASFLLLNIYLHVSWGLDSIMNSSTVSEASLFSLISKRNALFEELERFLQIPLEAQGKGISRTLACRVCVILAELWCLFGKSNYDSTKAASLGYRPDISTLEKFWKLCEQQLDISDETEDEDANKEYIEELNRDAVMIAAAKLVATGAVPKEHLAPEIISHYTMHGPTVAEVVKFLIVNIRKKDEDVSEIFSKALKHAHVRYLTVLDTYDESLSARRLKECKDLASRLSGFFVSIAARQNSQNIILKIVNEGVAYAFMNVPARLSFLTCAVITFASKLSKNDIYGILTNLQGVTRNVNMDEDPSGWRPYKTFVESLREKYSKNEDEREVREGTTVKRGRGRPRKNPKIEGKKLFDEKSSSEDEDEINASDHDDDEENQVDEDDQVPLIQSIRASAKLRALRVSRDENRQQTSKTPGVES
ncbi:putative armadillo-like helical, stromalin conservative domain, cohesin subunit Scc3/SA [Helianthus annuus]|uniref:Armadillo-like helical, stromalin conservative domain, cohesin subunit Scc3/SA n=1 Tax=Helianthus annuus TaxID=4232 RepID=A0A251TFV6_HELAN|nr:sister-chromatid cohesion protein 3 [Helianthus annuus]KAF5785128.1 putative armadillo-like helical, stromalin conservative domain, cohesin subunit Scc3/SA [Helianthus annuus]KAJ0512724.1 putative armadillo-like helical, stromalin conservative domain, cohesin subunit Scc3/SA [Helianthus annuus]KAJ0520348.1 putative armadillo-like helical, stromalin conservative domain, cohesin subunit Scc3/SA [Helianthus annuus]KAJ0528846.1 putative armadillo-like helical, stromalin conservative domain, cohe